MKLEWSMAGGRIEAAISSETARCLSEHLSAAYDPDSAIGDLLLSGIRYRKEGPLAFLNGAFLLGESLPDVLEVHIDGRPYVVRFDPVPEPDHV